MAFADPILSIHARLTPNLLGFRVDVKKRSSIRQGRFLERGCAGGPECPSLQALFSLFADCFPFPGKSLDCCRR